jgi:hypothetical protein
MLKISRPLATVLLSIAAFAGCQEQSAETGALYSPRSFAYNVRTFGAAGDGKKVDSRAINRAIDAAAAHGGGTVLLPAGTYLCGSIRLKSNINLHLESGARIVGLPADSKEFDPSETIPGPYFQDGGHTFFHNSLIWGENLRNVSITGQGMIDGGGITSRDKPVGDGPIGLADKAIALKLCSQVLIRDVTLFHGGHFAILATGCDLMTIDNVTIDTNRDGMDIDCCRNTTVSNCRVNSPRDDGICPKSSFGLGENRITENLVITNCEVSGFLEGTLLDGTMQPSNQRTGRIKFGTEANGGFRNVTVSNCTFRHCRGLALEEVDGGILENFNITNLTMTDIYSYGIYITTGERNRGPNVQNPSVLRNISISHVTMIGVDANSGIQITGVPGHPIENLRLDDIQLISNGGGTQEQANRVPYELAKGYPEPSRIGVMPAYGLYARHVKNLELANLRLSYEKEDRRQAIALSDVQGLEIDNLKAKVSQGVAPARFEAVTDALVRNSPVLEAGNGIMRSENARAGEPAPVPPPRRDTNNPAVEPVAGRPGANGARPTPRANDNPDARPNLPWLR